MLDIRLERFRPHHLPLLDNYGEQEWLRPYFEAVAEEAADSGQAVAVFAGKDFLGCAGVHPLHEYRAIAWAIFLPGKPEYFLKIHLLTLAFLRERLKTFARIEAYIDPEFSRAVRWVKSLGFREETKSKPYFFPDGRTGSEWVLIRG